MLSICVKVVLQSGRATHDTWQHVCHWKWEQPNTWQDLYPHWLHIFQLNESMSWYFITLTYGQVYCTPTFRFDWFMLYWLTITITDQSFYGLRLLLFGYYTWLLLSVDKNILVLSYMLGFESTWTRKGNCIVYSKYSNLPFPPLPGLRPRCVIELSRAQVQNRIPQLEGQ